MAEAQAAEQFLRSFWQWRTSLPIDQRWMADALAWSAAHGGDVQAYQADWSWGDIQSWFAEQNRESWETTSRNWRADATWTR